jgi:elongation factor Ts
MSISAKDVKSLRERTGAPMMECKNALAEAGGDVDAAIKVLRERGIAKAAKRADRGTSEGVIRCRLGANNEGATAVVVACETDFSARNEAFQALADKALAAAASLDEAGATPEAILDVAVDGTPFRAALEEIGNQIRENMQVAEVVRFGGTCGAYVHFDDKSAAIIEVAVGDAAKAGSDELAAALRDLCMHIVATDPAPLAVDESGISPELLEQEKEILVKQAVDSGKPQDIAEKMVVGRMKKFVAERALVAQPYVKDPAKTAGAFLDEAAKALGCSVEIKRFKRLQIGE